MKYDDRLCEEFPGFAGGSEAESVFSIDLQDVQGLLAQLIKAVVKRALSAELTHHLGYAPGGAPAHEGGKVEVGHDFITTVTHAVRTEVVEWQSRPLQRMYPTHWGAAAHLFALKFGERLISPPPAMEKQ